MNVVEIEAAISELALQPFDKEEFPFAFLVPQQNLWVSSGSGSAPSL